VAFSRNLLCRQNFVGKNLFGCGFLVNWGTEELVRIEWRSGSWVTHWKQRNLVWVRYCRITGELGGHWGTDWELRNWVRTKKLSENWGTAGGSCGTGRERGFEWELRNRVGTEELGFKWEGGCVLRNCVVAEERDGSWETGRELRKWVEEPWRIVLETKNWARTEELPRTNCLLSLGSEKRPEMRLSKGG
jgi:hypothetical protein